MAILESAGHLGLFIRHFYPEQAADLGEIPMNRATACRADLLDTP